MSGYCAVELAHLYKITELLLFITFMQGIYNYMTETNHISRVYSVAAIV
jgi:hypothetical protein